MNNQQQPKTLPLIALRGLVVFPGTLLHFDIGRQKSILAINAAMETGKELLLVSQTDIRDEEPTPEEISTFGCLGRVKQLLKLNDGTMRVLVEGKMRVKITEYIRTEPFFAAGYVLVPDTTPRNTVLYKEALIRRAKNLFDEYSELSPKLPTNVVLTVQSIESNPGYLADYIASNLPFTPQDKQTILECINPVKRLEMVCEVLEHEAQLMDIDMQISQKVKIQMDENQRDYYMREQLKALNEELYGEENPHEEADEYSRKIDGLKASDEVKQKLYSEVEKLEKTPPGSQEAAVIRNYIDTCISLPWGIFSEDKISIKKASDILEREHFGLSKVKSRILETLAVHSLTGRVSGSILCLAGPPGVGKTSIARSVAECMGRKFSRISLGGVHDEAEIRGHRRTYISALPGRIIDAVKLAGTANPVILLDEIDKLGSDYKGDPSSALLEALDPEQNSTFKDHFVDMPFDLSQVLFLTTANTTSTIPEPLLDRMELIELDGYTREDKFTIAKKYLVKKQLAKNGLNNKNCKISASAIYKIIDSYTREAGVRRLEQTIASLCRKAAKLIVSGEETAVSFTGSNLSQYLGVEKFQQDMLLPADEAGVVNGLAYTTVGGTLMRLEISVLTGTGKLELTGSLGEVMKESARAAVSFVRSVADNLGIDSEFYKNRDIHIHATETAVPKDGPSAGVTMVTALVSALSGIPVKRDIAMTGEVSIKGRVTAIGGLREKTMAAYTAGVKTVLIPLENKPDISELDPKVRDSLEIIPVSTALEAVELALTAPISKQKPFAPIPQNNLSVKPSTTAKQ